MDFNFELLATVTPSLNCIADRGGQFLWLSPAWRDTLGWTLEELKERPFIDFVHPDDIIATQREVVKLLSGAQTSSFNNRYARKDGGWCWLEWVARATSDGLIYASAHDVSARIESYSEQSQQNKLWQLASEMASVGYWRVDLGREHIFWSDEVYRIHGRDVASYKPTLADGIDAYHPEDRERVQRHVNRALRFATPFDFQLRIVQPSGDIRQIHSIGRCETNATGEVVALFGVFRDITEDTVLRRMNEELEQFSHVVSHDLIEPVRTIRSYADLLTDRYAGGLDQDGRKYVRYVRDSALRMHELLHDLLAYSRLEEPTIFENIELNKLVKETMADLALSIDKHNAKIVAEPLPPVTGNAVRLRLLLSNLLSNAIKFRGEAPPQVRITGRRQGPEVEVRVTDNGIGVPAEFRERVFQPFQRLHSPSAYKGTGIGLAIARRIVQQAGGTIRIEAPESGQGSCVVFSLPALFGDTG